MRAESLGQAHTKFQDGGPGSPKIFIDHGQLEGVGYVEQVEWCDIQNVDESV